MKKQKAKIQEFLERKGLEWSDLVKVIISLGLLGTFVVIMLIGAIGALIS